MTAIVFTLFLICLLGVVPAVPLVDVHVFVESYCPCSGQWQWNWWNNITSQVGSIVNLTRVYDGSNHDGRLSCFHGQDECKANALQRCVQQLYPYRDKWMQFTVCADGLCTGPKINMQFCATQYEVGTQRGIPIEERCAAGLGMNFSSIMECANGPEGKQLLISDDLMDTKWDEFYGMQGLPVVYIGKTRFSAFWDCSAQTEDYQKRFVAAICAAYNGPAASLPAACAPDSLRSQPIGAVVMQKRRDGQKTAHLSQL